MRAFCTHADAYAVVLKDARQVLAGELTALIRVE
jgi:hypothetical protein